MYQVFSFPHSSLESEISHLKANIIKLEKPYQSLSTPNDPSFLLLVSDLRSEISHLCSIISLQCTITSSFKLPTQPTLTSSSSKSSSQPTFSSTSSYCSNQSTNHPILSTFFFYLLLFLNPVPYYLLNIQLFTPMSQLLNVVTIHLSLFFLPIISIVLSNLLSTLLVPLLCHPSPNSHHQIQ